MAGHTRSHRSNQSLINAAFKMMAGHTCCCRTCPSSIKEAFRMHHHRLTCPTENNMHQAPTIRRWKTPMHHSICHCPSERRMRHRLGLVPPEKKKQDCIEASAEKELHNKKIPPPLGQHVKTVAEELQAAISNMFVFGWMMHYCCCSLFLLR